MLTESDALWDILTLGTVFPNTFSNRLIIHCVHYSEYDSCFRHSEIQHSAPSHPVKATCLKKLRHISVMVMVRIAMGNIGYKINSVDAEEVVEDKTGFLL